MKNIRKTISESSQQSHLIILRVGDVGYFMPSVVQFTCFLIASQTCAAKITRNLSVTGGEPADISVCFGCFISGKSSMTHRVLNRAQDRLNQLLGP